MSEWGRKRYQVWPSRKPVWTLTAFFGALLTLVFMMGIQYTRDWSFVERFYLPVYLRKAWIYGMFPKAADAIPPH